MSDLTPYDTGERLEPQPWVRVAVTENAQGHHAWLPPADAWGKVDFDNDEGATIATVWFEKQYGHYVMHLQDHSGDLTIEHEG